MNELSKVGNRAIHELAARKGWQEGSEEKILAHSIFGGLLSSLAGGKITTGTLAGGVGEYVNGRILAAKGKAWVKKAPGPGPDHQRRGRKCRGGRDRRKQHREQCEPWGDEVE